jgi:hypothetical protein
MYAFMLFLSSVAEASSGISYLVEEYTVKLFPVLIGGLLGAG